MFHCKPILPNIGHSGFSSLRFGASLSVGGRQLDAAAASTLPIVHTTLEAEVQTISRQLYAILVVKLEGKARGIVQLVNKGEGLEVWRQLKLEYEGQVREQTSCVVARNSQPKGSLGGWRKRWSLGGRVAEQMGEDHWPLPDSEWSGHLRWYLGCYSTGATRLKATTKTS